jgi:hypothetical protein
MLVWDQYVWVAEAIRRACNGEVSLATLEAVRDWMVRSTGMPPSRVMALEDLGPDDIAF